jgi:hypothetical protein
MLGAILQVVGRVEHGRAMKDKKASRVEQETDHEGVALEYSRESVQIRAPGQGKAWVLDNVFEGKPQAAPCEPVAFLPFQLCP